LWFERAAVDYPSSNNGLEATNGVIKRDHTLQTRLPVGQFLQSGSKLLEKWSYARNPASVNCIPFAAVRSHSLAHWTAAYQWAAKNSKVLQVDDEGRTSIFYTTSTCFGKPICKKILGTTLSKQNQWKTFNEFRKYQHGVCKIQIDRENVTNSSCSCPFFLKHLTRKHSLGMLIRLKLSEVPPQAKNVPLGQKRKRGRPGVAKKALIVQ